MYSRLFLRHSLLAWFTLAVARCLLAPDEAIASETATLSYAFEQQMCGRSVDEIRGTKGDLLGAPWLISGSNRGLISYAADLSSVTVELTETRAQALEGPPSYPRPMLPGKILISRVEGEKKPWKVVGSAGYEAKNNRDLIQIANLLLPVLTGKPSADGNLQCWIWNELDVTQHATSHKQIILKAGDQGVLTYQDDDYFCVWKTKPGIVTAIELRGTRSQPIRELIVAKFDELLVDLEKLFRTELKQSNAYITTVTFRKQSAGSESPKPTP